MMQWFGRYRTLQAYVIVVVMTIAMLSHYTSERGSGILKVPLPAYHERARPRMDSQNLSLVVTTPPTKPAAGDTTDRKMTLSNAATQRGHISFASIRPSGRVHNSAFANASVFGLFFNGSNSTSNYSGKELFDIVPLDLPQESVVSSDNGSNSKSSPRAVIIVTEKRSGSSFCGQFLNQHPDVFYVYEPLKCLDYADYKDQDFNSTYSYYSDKILNSIMQCDFTNDIMQFRMPDRQRLCRNISKPSKKRRQYLATLEQTCKHHKVVATKVIRVHDIADLKDMLMDTDVDWRIIHLVRDPRPTMRSRWKSGPNINLIRRKGSGRNDTADLCETLERNAKFWLETPDWLRGRYKMIRYEDVASSPHKYANELLEFSGIEMSEVVTSWIRNNTMLDSPDVASSKKTRTFGTARDTDMVLRRWRTDMNWKKVQKIQNVCFRAITSFGYTIMPDKNTLRNISIPSTLPLGDLMT